MIALAIVSTLAALILLAWRPVMDLGSYLWEDRNDPPSC